MSESLSSSQLRNTQLFQVSGLNRYHNFHKMSDEEDQQDFRNQDFDGLEQDDQDEDMDVGSSSKHKSNGEVEGDPEEVDEEEGDDDDDDDDEDEDEDEEESPGRKGRKRAKVY